MSLLDEALRAPNCAISVMGAHVGENAAAIPSRKISDCREIGRTFWVAKSAKARPAQVQAICDSSHGYVIFVEPATPGGARPTKEADSTTAYSPDRHVAGTAKRNRTGHRADGPFRHRSALRSDIGHRSGPDNSAGSPTRLSPCCRAPRRVR